MTHTYYKCSKCHKIVAPPGFGSHAFLYCENCKIWLPNYNYEEPANHRRTFLNKKNWDESDRRLRDPEYALKLKIYGFNVPDRYITEEMKPILEEIEREKKKDYDDLMREQKKYRVGKLMLSKGKFSNAVKDASNQMKMTPDEFLVLCKEWVNSYQEKHRQYNLTHYPPANYPD